MTTMEDRLSAALAARADLIQPEGLRPVPPFVPRRPRLRRPATYLLAAAAAAGALALPFAFSGDSQPSPVPPGTQAPSPSQSPSVGGDDWPLVRTERLDLDGDGVDDEVQVRRGGGEVRFVAELSATDSQAMIQFRGPGIALRVLAADLDGNGDEEMVVGEYIGRFALRVIDLMDGGSLMPVDQSEAAPLTAQYTREGRVQRWWVDQGSLYSSRSAEVLAVSDHYVPLPEVYAVDVWSWTLVDGALVPQDLGRQCVRAGAPQRPFPC